MSRWPFKWEGGFALYLVATAVLCFLIGIATGYQLGRVT